MIANKAGYGAGASGGVHFDLFPTEPPNGPALIMGGLVEGGIPFPIDASWPMPIVAVCLDDQPSGFEHEVGLKPPKHHLVHVELKAALLELVAQETFDTGHLLRKGLAQSSLTAFLPRFRGSHLSNRGLSHLLSMFGMVSPILQGSLTLFLPGLRRHFLAPVDSAYFLPRLWPQVSPAQYLTGLGRSLINSCRHFMCNYNRR